ncbi:hypothetical protein [Streptomyces sp. fd1-xmd]|uniref:hypothetical protein n=1 Tax=Streptomyces sp. fd1-xmd TaxID=1812480 RepID=UPI001CECE498|nr:hypothetical protein [Streptomyces sp. fd1-xmd]
MATEQLRIRPVVAGPHPGDQVPVGRRQLGPGTGRTGGAGRTGVPPARFALGRHLPGGQTAYLGLASGATG